MAGASGSASESPEKRPRKSPVSHRPGGRHRRWWRGRGRIVFHSVFWPLLGLFLIAVGIVGVVGFTLYGQVRAAQSALEGAQSTVSQIQGAVTAHKLDQLPPLAAKLESQSQQAVDATGGELWSFAEGLPLVGENFRAVEVIGHAVQTVSTQLVTPASAVAGELKIKRDPATGRFDTAPIRQGIQLLDTAGTVLDDVSAQMATINTDETVGQIRDAVGKFDALADKVQQTLPGVRAAVGALTGLFGLDGPQNVLLAFLNNAETAPLGGGPAAQTLMHVDDGEVQIVDQISSVSEFPPGTRVDVDVDDSTAELYHPPLLDHINGSISSPDFPTGARILSAYWSEYEDTPLDTVVAISPLALGPILKVTGPITLSTGDVLNADNVVEMLLNKVYFMYPANNGADADRFFQEASSAIFDRLMSADYDVWKMADALISAANSGALYAWSANEQTESYLASTPFGGVLPTSNAEKTLVGVYYRDRSASKSSYYLRSQVSVEVNRCDPSVSVYTVDARFWVDLPVSASVPSYIDSNLYSYFRYETFLYGPVGAQTSDVEVVDRALSATMGPQVDDLGRPAVKVTFNMNREQPAEVKVTFTAPPDTSPNTVLQVTPLVNASENTVTQVSCG